MKRKRPKLYLIGQDPADVFNDLDKLRGEAVAPPLGDSAQSKPSLVFRTTRAWRFVSTNFLAGLGATDRAGSTSPQTSRAKSCKVCSARLRAIGLKAGNRRRALQQLVAAGVVLVERRGPGLAPQVTHLWYPAPGLKRWSG